MERITVIIPWIELARDSAQLAVRLTKAWGVGAHDGATAPVESWKIISADAGEPRSPTARKVRKTVKATQKTMSRVARTATKRTAKTHPKSKVVRRLPHR
jgi:hypothetical protein